MVIVGGISSVAQDELARMVAAMETMFGEIWCIFREGRWTIQCAKWINISREQIQELQAQGQVGLSGG
jgi:hypothetical protein